MNQRKTRPPAGPWGLSPVVAGTACCITSALGYTAANTCMRQLAALGSDPMWAICNKELVTVAVVGSWLLCRGRRDRAAPSWRLLAVLALVGVTVQLAGNLCTQWALGIAGVGLAIAIPAMFGAMLTASAILGRFVLRERVSGRAAAAIGLLLLSLGLLAVGAATTDKSDPGIARPPLIMLGVAAACLAGCVYAVLTITIRRMVTGTVPPSTVVLVITATGVLTLGPLSGYRLGWDLLLATPPEHLLWMLAAGGFNLMAFLAITKGLQLTTVVHANVLNASQVALAAVAGTVLFDEPLKHWSVLGVALTIVGIVLIDRPAQDERAADQHA